MDMRNWRIGEIRSLQMTPTGDLVELSVHPPKNTINRCRGTNHIPYSIPMGPAHYHLHPYGDPRYQMQRTEDLVRNEMGTQRNQWSQGQMHLIQERDSLRCELERVTQRLQQMEGSGQRGYGCGVPIHSARAIGSRCAPSANYRHFQRQNIENRMTGNQGFGVQTDRNGYGAHDNLDRSKEQEICRLRTRLQQIWSEGQVLKRQLNQPHNGVPPQQLQFRG